MLFRSSGPRPFWAAISLPDDEKAGAAPVAIIGYGVWKDRYGGRADILGRSVRINEVPTTIIGVMPKDFKFPQNEDVWLAAAPEPDWQKRDNRFLLAFGPLAKGVDFGTARAELDLIQNRLAEGVSENQREFGNPAPHVQRRVSTAGLSASSFWRCSARFRSCC